MAESTSTPEPASSGSGSAGGAPVQGSLGIGVWLPWLALLVVGTVVGAVLGVAGVAGRPVDHSTVANSGILIGMNLAARSCPGGPVVAELTPGSRVLALARSEDGSAVQVRNPADTRVAVWIPASELVSDVGEPAIASLPIGEACPTVTVPVPVVETPAVVPPTTGTNPPPPPPPSDTTKPTIGAISASTSGNLCYFVASVSASDNVEVTGVTLAWTGPVNGSGAMTAQGGGVWRFERVGNVDNTPGGNYTLNATARDAAENTVTSAPAVVVVQCFG